MEEQLVPRAGLRLETIHGGPIAGVRLWTRLLNLAKLTWSLGSTWRLLARFKPDVLFMTGGYVNVPVALVAWLRRLPATVYLPDVEPGAAIKFLSRFTQKVACTADGSQVFFPAGKTITTGYPVRTELRQATSLPQADALATFDLTPGRKTLFVFGGSRGARSINRALMAALPQLLEQIQVIHISGTLDWPEVEAFAKTLPAGQRPYYRPYPYLHEEMGPAFRSADLVVARGGASMLGECPAFGLPSILVPYPYAWRYQKVNADYLSGRGAGLRLNDEAMAEQLLPMVLGLMNDPGRLANMSSQAKKLDIPNAAGNIAHLIRRLARGQ